MAELGSYYITIMPSMKGFTSAVNKELGGLGTSGGKSFAGSFGDVLKGSAIGTALGNLATKAGSALVGGLRTGIGRLDTMQNFPRVMQAFGYSADEASKSIKLIQDRLYGLPTASQEVVALTQSISDSTPTLDMATRAALGFNDMMLAGGASTAEMATATGVFNRILGKGSATVAQWQSLQSVMPKQLDMVSEAMLGAGASSMDLYEKLEAGEVSYQDFLAAIIKLDEEGSSGMASFYEQAKAASIGIDSAIKNIENRIGAGWANIMEVIGQKEIHDVLEGIGNGFKGVLDSVANVLQGLKEKFADLGTFDKLQTVMGLLGEKFQGFSSAVSDAVGKAIPAIAELIDKGLQWIIDHGDSISNFIDTIAGAFGKVAETIGGALSGVMPVLGDLIDKALTWILDHGEVVVALLGAMAAKMAFDGVVNAAGNINNVATSLGALADVLPMVTKIGDLPAAFQLVAETGGPLGNVFKNLGKSWTSLTGSFGTLSSLGPTLSSAFGSIGASLSGLGSTILSVATGPVGIIVAAIAGIGLAIKTLWDTNENFRNTIMGIWDGIVSKFGEAGERIGKAFEAIAKPFGAIGKTIGDVGGKILEVLGKIWEVASSVIGPGVVALVGSISSVISGIVDVITGVFEVIGGLFEGFQTGDWTMFTDGLKAIWDGFWGVVLAPVQGAIDAVKYTLEELGYKWDEVVGALQAAWEGFVGFFQGLWEGITTGISEFCTNVSTTWEGLKTGAAEVFGGIRDEISRDLEDAKTVGAGAVNMFVSAATGDWEGLASSAETVFTTIDSSITDHLQAAKDSGIPIVSDLAGGALEKWEWLKTEGTSKFNDLAKGIGDALQSAKEWAEQKGREIQEFWESIPEKIAGFFSGIGQKITDAFGSIHFPAPHVTWEDIPIGPLSIPIPHIDWYAKGGIFDTAALIGVGEAGSEAVLPLNAKTYGAIAQGISGEMGGTDLTDELRGLREDVRALQLVVQLDSGAIAGGVYPYIDSRMETDRRREARRR